MIYDNILKAGEVRAIYFPSLITELCKHAGVLVRSTDATFEGHPDTPLDESFARAFTLELEPLPPLRDEELDDTSDDGLEAYEIVLREFHGQ